MARTLKPEPGMERAVELGTRGESAAVTLAGVAINPYSYGTPCYWAWHGANEARKVLTDGTN